MKNGHPLTIKMDIRNKEGKKVGEKEVVTYHGLLAKAHDEGLRRVVTEVVQVPTKENGMTAVVRATIETQRGTFSGIGDASPSNVGPHIAVHLLRLAETRAKARALRDAVNIGVVAIEELGDLIEDEVVMNGATRRQVANITSTTNSVPERNDFQPMSEAQRRLLFRLAAQRGIQVNGIKSWLEVEFNVASLRAVSRADASRMIDRLNSTGKDGGNTEVV